jgi:ActD protein
MIVAAFRDERTLTDALARLRESRIGPIETYTPAPIEGEDKSSVLPLVVLVAGLVGAAASFGLQTYSSVWAYPLIIGGRPAFAWPSFIPTVFENAVLVAVVAGFVGYFVINRMPRLYDPVDEADVMRRATSDRWCLSVRTDDRAVLDQARAVLMHQDALEIEEVPA